LGSIEQIGNLCQRPCGPLVEQPQHRLQGTPSAVDRDFGRCRLVPLLGQTRKFYRLKTDPVRKDPASHHLDRCPRCPDYPDNLKVTTDELAAKGRKCCLTNWTYADGLPLWKSN
jgi:hypothetical protein